MSIGTHTRKHGVNLCQEAGGGGTRKKPRLNLISVPHGVVRSGERTAKGTEEVTFSSTTHIHTLWLQSRHVSTWTSIQLPCLCNVSFTEPGPLAYSRSDSVFVSGWKNGVEKHPPLVRKESDLTTILHFTVVYKAQWWCWCSAYSVSAYGTPVRYSQNLLNCSTTGWLQRESVTIFKCQ